MVIPKLNNSFGDRIYFRTEEIGWMIKHYLNIDIGALDEETRNHLLEDIIHALFLETSIFSFYSQITESLLESHGKTHQDLRELIMQLTRFYQVQFEYVNSVIDKYKFDYSCEITFTVINSRLTCINIFLTDEFYPALDKLNTLVNQAIEDGKHVPYKYLKILGRL